MTPNQNHHHHSKKKAVHKATAGDDKRLQSTLKRLGVHLIPGIDEVAIFSDDGTAVHFPSPKVQASINANTFVVSGPSSVKSHEEIAGAQAQQAMLQGLQGMSQEQIQALIAQMQSVTAAGGAGGAAAAAAAGTGGEGGEEAAAAAGGGDDDEDIPELVENAE